MNITARISRWDFFDGWNTTDGLDEAATIERYAQQVEEGLSKAYPHDSVEVKLVSNFVPDWDKVSIEFDEDYNVSTEWLLGQQVERAFSEACQSVWDRQCFYVNEGEAS